MLFFFILFYFFFFNDTATTEIYTLSLHDALPILILKGACRAAHNGLCLIKFAVRSEEHTSELQSRPHLVCRLLLEKKNKTNLTRNFRNSDDRRSLARLALHHR